MECGIWNDRTADECRYNINNIANVNTTGYKTEDRIQIPAVPKFTGRTTTANIANKPIPAQVGKVRVLHLIPPCLHREQC